MSRAVLDDFSKTEVRFRHAPHSRRLVGSCLVVRNEFKNAVLVDEGGSDREEILGTSPRVGDECSLNSASCVGGVGAVLWDVSFELELVARHTQLGTSQLRFLDVLNSPFILLILTRRTRGSG